MLLDFYADWCGSCRMVSPIVEKIAEENPQYLIGKVNVDKEPELAQQFQVLSRQHTQVSFMQAVKRDILSLIRHDIKPQAS